jgi:hypothetical protein
MLVASGDDERPTVELVHRAADDGPDIFGSLGEGRHCQQDSEGADEKRG